jgi:outer membrane biogenesis lipoprotein LolB
MAVAMDHRGFNAAVRWHKNGSSFDLALWGPFGAGAVQLAGQLQGPFTMTQRGKVQSYQALPEEVLWKELGVWFPISLLQYWVLGQEAPQWPAQWQHTSQGDILQQAGFTVQVQSRDDVVGLPQRLTILGQGARMKLFIRQWLLPRRCHET